MSIRQPGMHRYQADFGSISHQNEQECDLHDHRVKTRGRSPKIGPGHDTSLTHSLWQSQEEKRPEKTDQETERVDDEVFPGGFGSRRLVVETDQEGGRQSRRLDSDPHQYRIGGIGRHKHSEKEQLEQNKELLDPTRTDDVLFYLLTQVSDRIKSNHTTDTGNNQRKQKGKRIQREVLPDNEGRPGLECHQNIHAQSRSYESRCLNSAFDQAILRRLQRHDEKRGEKRCSDKIGEQHRKDHYSVRRFMSAVDKVPNWR